MIDEKTRETVTVALQLFEMLCCQLNFTILLIQYFSVAVKMS